jgi:hypothetical protein
VTVVAIALAIAPMMNTSKEESWNERMSHINQNNKKMSGLLFGCLQNQGLPSSVSLKAAVLNLRRT